jgi:hypothetical protein
MARRPLDPTATCECGHLGEAHEHYRPGTDCSLCTCERFRPVPVTTRTNSR